MKKRSAGSSDPANLRRHLIEILAKEIDKSPENISTNRPLSSYGLDSLQLTLIIRKLSADLGREIPVTTIWAHPTVDAMVNYLVSGEKRG